MSSFEHQGPAVDLQADETQEGETHGRTSEAATKVRAAMGRRHVQRKASRGGSGSANIPSGGGAPLAGAVRGKMEGQLGADLSNVRVHDHGQSAEAADQLGARAFTVGSDVHFNKGEFAPGTKEGDRLLAHELTHVVQGAGSAVQRKAQSGHDEAEHDVSQPGDPAEHEADSVGDHVAENLHAKPDAKGGSHRAPKIAPPRISSGGAAVSRKIFRAEKKGPPPIPAAAGGPKAGAKPGEKPGAEGAAAQKDPEEQKTEEWCTGELVHLRTLNIQTVTKDKAQSVMNELGSFQIGLDMHKNFPQNEKVKEATKFLTDSKSQVEDRCMLDLTLTVQAKMGALPVDNPGSYGGAGQLLAGVEAWGRAFPSAKEGAAAFAAINDAKKQIEDKKKAVVSTRNAALSQVLAAIQGVNVEDPGNVIATQMAIAQVWLGAADLPETAAKSAAITGAKTAKEAEIAAAKQKKKEDDEKKQKEQQAAQAGKDKGKDKAPAADGGKGAPAAAQPGGAQPDKSAATPAASPAALPPKPPAPPAAEPAVHAVPPPPVHAEAPKAEAPAGDHAAPAGDHAAPDKHAAAPTAQPAGDKHAAPAGDHAAGDHAAGDHAAGDHADPKAAAPPDPETIRLQQRQQELTAVIKGLSAEVQAKYVSADQKISAGLTVVGTGASFFLTPLAGAAAGLISFGTSKWLQKERRDEVKKQMAVIEKIETITDASVLEQILMFFAEADGSLAELQQQIEKAAAAVEKEKAGEKKDEHGAEAKGDHGGEEKKDEHGGGEHGDDHGGGHGGLRHRVHQGEEIGHVGHTVVEGVAAASEGLHHALHNILPGVGLVVLGVKETLLHGEMNKLKEAITEMNGIRDVMKALGLQAIQPPEAGGGAAAPAHH